MTEFTSSLSYLENITEIPFEEVIELINSNDVYISQDEHDAVMEFLEYDCSNMDNQLLIVGEKTPTPLAMASMESICPL